MTKNNRSPPAKFISKEGSGIYFPATVANKERLPIFITPFPKQNDGKNLKTHQRATPASLVEGIILNINIIRGIKAPDKKWRKKEATQALP